MQEVNTPATRTSALLPFLTVNMRLTIPSFIEIIPKSYTFSSAVSGLSTLGEALGARALPVLPHHMRPPIARIARAVIPIVFLSITFLRYANNAHTEGKEAAPTEVESVFRRT